MRQIQSKTRRRSASDAKRNGKTQNTLRDSDPCAAQILDGIQERGLLAGMWKNVRLFFPGMLLLVGERWLLCRDCTIIVWLGCCLGWVIYAVLRFAVLQGEGKIGFLKGIYILLNGLYPERHAMAFLFLILWENWLVYLETGGW